VRENHLQYNLNLLWSFLAESCDWTYGRLTYLLTYLLSYVLTPRGHDIIWKADSHLACQTVSCFLYGNRRFIAVLTKAHYWTLSWASRIQFAPSIPLSLRSILMLSSHLRLAFTLFSSVPCYELYASVCNCSNKILKTASGINGTNMTLRV